MKKNDNFSYEKYCELINSRKSLWDEPENDYKANYIPNYLYKYWTFDSSHFDENLKRILYGTIWMPLASTLNDPFEFQMLSDSLSEEQRMEFRKDTLDRNSVLSLCSSHTNNLLWSHYSFAHTGICLEFEVVNTERLFPVIYQRYQEDYTDEITQWLEVKRNVIKKKPEEITNSERVLLAKAQKIMLVKKTDWKYEKEFRITGRKPDNDKDTDGFFINHGYWEKVTDLGIKLRRIIFSLIVIGQKFYAMISQSRLAASLSVPNDTAFTTFVKHHFYFELGEYLLIAHNVFLNCNYAAFMRVFDISKAIAQNKHKSFQRKQRS